MRPPLFHEPLKGLRVLLVEDDEVNIRVITGFLQIDSPTCVDVCRSGQEAVERASIAGACYDLILMDIHMPGMDGIEATRRIREAGVSTPIVVITADSIFPENEFLKAGANAWLYKPISRQGLLTSFQNAFSASGGPGRKAEGQDIPARDENESREGTQVFDQAAFETTFAGERELCASVAKDFLAQTEGLKAKLTTALIDGDPAAAFQCCHKLAGSAMALKAFPVAAAASELEDALRSGGTLEGCFEGFEALWEDLHALETTLRKAYAW